MLEAQRWAKRWDMANLRRITVNDPRYEDLVVRGDNERSRPQPESFALVTSTAEVVNVVEQAVRAGQRIAVRSSGQGFENLLPDPAAHLVIDLAEMNHMWFDRDRGAFAVEPGARMLDLYRSLYFGWGVTVPGGASASVAAGGHILGGGYGPLSRQFGMCVDHLYGVEVVVVDDRGRARAVLATRDPADPNHDLWWTHTGGGGAVGVVTRYWLRSPDATGDDPPTALPSPPASILATNVVFPREGLSQSALRVLVGNYCRWHEDNSAPNSLYRGLFAGLVLRAAQPHNDPGIGAILFVNLDGTRPDAHAALAQAIADITGGVDAGQFAADVERQPWLSSMVRLGAAEVHGIRRHKIKSAYLRRGYTTQQIDVLFDYLRRTDHAIDNATVSLQSAGGAINSIGPEATAVAQRDSVLRAFYVASWQDPSADKPNLDWIRRLYRDVYAETGGVPVPDERSDGCYINYPDLDLADPTWNTSGVPWQYLYFKENHLRLKQIKKKWDPLGAFNHALSVQ